MSLLAELYCLLTSWLHCPCMPAGFTDMSKQVEPRQVMTFLNKLFTVLDKMVDTFGVQKVETAGDCYIAACGILSREEGGGFSVVGEQHDAEDSACRVMAFAKAMLEASKQVISLFTQVTFRYFFSNQA